MTLNVNVCSADEFDPSFNFRGFLDRGEDPGLGVAVPVLARQPLFALVLMPALCPIP